MRNLIASLILVAVAALGLALTPPHEAAQAANTGTFIIRCNRTHTGFIDPIVNPGPRGTPSSHLHQFYGNPSVQSDSTEASMRAADTVCRHEKDTAGYWAPALMRPDGTQVVPLFSFAYYKLEPQDVAFPAGLKVVAGGVGQENRTFWDCFRTDGHFDSPPLCEGSGNYLVNRLRFPDCWDGVHLDSADHRSHMAYSRRRGVCPDSHPVDVPGINFFQRFPVGEGGPGYRLSDGTTTTHADFWNTWDQPTLEALVEQCRFENCGQVRT